MIDISEKEATKRVAAAEGQIRLRAATIEAIRNNKVKKGNVLEVARVAGILAVKAAANIIPYCHTIPIEHVAIDFELGAEHVTCRCSVKATYKTGVEMEALIGVAAALLTVWDMVKYLEKDEAGLYPSTAIHNLRVIKKKITSAE